VAVSGFDMAENGVSVLNALGWGWVRY